METYFVYILQSLKDGSFYVGECDDLDKRMPKHSDGMSKYSTSKRPLRLRYFELLPTRIKAIKREKEIKRKKSRKYLEHIINNWLRDFYLALNIISFQSTPILIPPAHKIVPIHHHLWLLQHCDFEENQ